MDNTNTTDGCEFSSKIKNTENTYNTDKGKRTCETSNPNKYTDGADGVER